MDRSAVKTLAKELKLFPAHAGMDRQLRCSGPRLPPVPRTRGDGPSVRENSSSPETLFPAHAGMDRESGLPGGHHGSCSPHTRGWTVADSPRAEPDELFPAHAGMDRCCRWWHSTSVSVPRTRGDGPDLIRFPIHIQELFPAHAGMERGVSTGPWGVCSCSPHTRGWTVDLGGQGRPAGLFPAHAGMDRVLLRR